MKILVLGAGGMAGHVIALTLQEKGYEVTGIARRPLSFCPVRVLDVSDADALQEELNYGEYDAVVNAVGVLNKAVSANPCAGIWTNACFPHWLALATENLPTRVIHLSTDCVFSGKRGGYTEEDFKDGENIVCHYMCKKKEVQKTSWATA